MAGRRDGGAATAREEIAAQAELWEWEALASPLMNEMIYRRGDAVTIFCQFDNAGVLRRALRYHLDNRLRKVSGEIAWDSPRKVATLIGWFGADGARPVRRAAAGAR